MVSRSTYVCEGQPTKVGRGSRRGVRGRSRRCEILNDEACPPLDFIPVRRSAWRLSCVTPCMDRDRLRPQETKLKEGKVNGALHRPLYGCSSFFMSLPSSCGRCGDKANPNADIPVDQRQSPPRRRQICIRHACQRKKQGSGQMLPLTPGCVGCAYGGAFSLFRSNERERLSRVSNLRRLKRGLHEPSNRSILGADKPPHGMRKLASFLCHVPLHRALHAVKSSLDHSRTERHAGCTATTPGSRSIPAKT